MQKSVWDHLATALPPLYYKQKEVSTQNKSTTENAAFSRSPMRVVDWADFGRFIEQEATKATNQKIVDSRVAGMLANAGQLLHVVYEEEHVTQNAVTVLNCARDLLPVEFVSGNKYLKSNTDITALSSGVAGLSIDNSRVGPLAMYASPRKNKKKVREEYVQDQKVLVRLPIESKPFWKYQALLDVTFSFQESFEVPKAPWQGTDVLPEGWTACKRKVFHLIRQIYGQMTEDNLRYGVIHVYEMWWFCRRDSNGTLLVSRGISHASTNPSVLQALQTLLGFDDYELEKAASHDQTPIMAPAPNSGPGVRDCAKLAQSTPQTDAAKNKGGGEEQSSAALGTKAAR